MLFGDLRPLKGRKIVWAKLNFTEVAAGDSRQSCPASLWQVTDAPVSFDPPAVHLADNAVSGTLVSDTVRAWHAGRDNHGFMFVSEGEGMTEQPSQRCLSDRGDFVLQVATTKPAA